ncbi:CubicO group peptidase (beta-lactamase class C family) [Jatrophihabitans sp. GAS493]|uniref:serine hydrolase domain-containing protein n=1 Tax=Jatrophihabitans sp. GAS493 TaxID=1907575 RepID=UPI000BB7C1F3|nr:serine hydrolase domain-containing protein [Jatrophihabitans sp. GAS493]SOD71485.1 CubicO group peptidase (beta-lactamase class C family) [Jatrophihabitans sp. GAS493]
MSELLPETRHTLAHRVATGQVAGRAPSLIAGVVRGSSLAWAGGHGFLSPGVPPDTNTQYRIGSITKTFVAVLIMRLRNEGRLDLSDRLSTFLPETAAAPGVGTARIGELLAHTSGIASETPPPWWERAHGSSRPQLADIYGETPAKLTAGRHFHYSNTGFGLLGALVGVLRGANWLEVARSEILDPLGMGRTTPMPQPPHALGWAVHPWADLLMPEPTPDAELMAPAGQLWSTIDDLATYAAFLLDGHPDVLPLATLEEMRTPASPPSSTPAGPSWESGFGLGLQLARIEGRSLAGHTGSMPGFVATLWTSPADALAGICLANATSGPLVAAIAADMIALVAKHEPTIPPPWRPAEGFDPVLLELTGPWYWGATAMALRLREGGDLELVALNQLGRTSRFRAQPNGTWLGLDGYYLGETLQAVRGSDGTVSHLDIGSFVYTRQPYEPGRGDDPVPGGVDAQGWRGSADL